MQSIKKVVKETVDLLKSIADNKHIKLKFDSDLKQEHFQFDQIRTQQILINLLTNAIKFSHQDSMVFITVLTI